VKDFTVGYSEILLLYTSGKVAVVRGLRSATSQSNYTFVDVAIGTGRTAVQITSDSDNHCALLDDASVVCFGLADWSIQFVRVDPSAPLEVSAPGTANYVRLNTRGSLKAHILLKNTNVSMWYNPSNIITYSFQYLGPGGLDTPTLFQPWDPQAPLVKGYNLLCAIMNATTPVVLACDGRGGNDLSNDFVGPAIPVTSPTQAIKVALSGGADHACIIRTDGKVLCSGLNGNGQLGRGFLDGSNTPKAFNETLDLGASAVSGAMSSLASCVVLTTGELKCWGRFKSDEVLLVPQAMNLIVTANPTGSPTAAATGDAPGLNIPLLAGAIAGGVAGAFLLSVLGAVVYKRRRTRAKQQTFFNTARVTTAFLSHEWGQDSYSTNHKRVSALNDELRKQGVITWFDSDQLSGDVMSQIVAGIDRTKLVVVFITKGYLSKVAQPDDSKVDYCRLEFKYAVRRKGPEKMLVVVMDPDLLNPSTWVGPVGAVLGDMLYINYSKDELLSSAAKNLKDMINRKVAELGLDVEAGNTAMTNAMVEPK
jgi:hypothetical protein